MKSGVVIPVYNESNRVIPVVEAAKQSAKISEVIVVNDGSTDNTAEVLGVMDGITIISHDQNCGKGEALDSGMRHLIQNNFDAAVFLDGDLCGLNPNHINQLLTPLEDQSIMVIGYLGLRKLVVKKAILNHWGGLSGQRAIRTEIWDLLEPKDKHGFNIESALNVRLRKNNLRKNISSMALEGVSHIGKREKEPTIPKALKAYIKTYGSALLTYARIELEAIKS